MHVPKIALQKLPVAGSTAWTHQRNSARCEGHLPFLIAWNERGFLFFSAACNCRGHTTMSTLQQLKHEVLLLQ